MGLGIREARNTLPSLIKRAADEEEEIQLGARGADEVTLVATRKYQRMSRELDDLRAENEQLRERLGQASDDARVTSTGRPYAGLQRALDQGQFTLASASAPRLRRYYPDYTHSGTASREDRIRFGSETAQPEYRRPQPRA